MSKPCEYCGVDLPLGVDKRTRRVRSFHFASCEKRPQQTTPHSLDIEAQRDALLEQRDELRRALEIIAVGDATNPQAQAAEELTALGYWKATAHEAQKHSNAELKLYEGEKG